MVDAAGVIAEALDAPLAAPLVEAEESAESAVAVDGAAIPRTVATVTTRPRPYRHTERTLAILVRFLCPVVGYSELRPVECCRRLPKDKVRTIAHCIRSALSNCALRHLS